METALPPAGRWAIDPRHTSIIFTVKHLMVARVRGRFDAFSGELTIDEAPERSGVRVVIEAASINSGVAKRDGHLRSADFLEVATYPTIDYRSTEVRTGPDGAWEVAGELTMHGTTLPVPLAVTYLGTHADMGVPVTAFSAVAEFEREPFGLTFNRPLEAGGMAIGSLIKVELEVEAMPADAAIQHAH